MYASDERRAFQTARSRYSVLVKSSSNKRCSPFKRYVAMAQFVGKPLPDFQVKPLAKGALGAKTSLKGIAAGRPLVIHLYNGG